MRTVLITTSLLIGIAVPLHAQTDAGAVVGATAAAINMDGATSFSFSGSVGYQFTRIVGIEIEATATPTFKPASSPSGQLLYPWTSTSVTGSRSNTLIYS